LANKRKKPAEERCTYCGCNITGDNVTEDHIISRRWYPASTPATVPRWWVYCCNTCNNKFSLFEQYVLVRLSMCVNPEIPESAGVLERAKRAMDYKSTTDLRERNKRKAVFDAVGRDIQPIRELPPAGVLPSFLRNRAEGSDFLITIDGEGKLDPLIEKWARGIHRHIWRTIAPQDAHIEIMHVDDAAASVAFRQINDHGQELDGGPGVKVSYLMAEGDGHRIVIYSFLIWGQFRCYATIEESFTPA